MEYYTGKVGDALKKLNTSKKGLSQKEADNRLDKYGLNELKEGKKISKLQIFISQFQDPLILILIAASVIAAIIGYLEYLSHGGDIFENMLDSIVISIILFLNAILGFVQEYNAEKAIEALKKMASLKAVVIREGKQKEVEAKELVPGDIIILSEGERIPADSRLIEAVSLQTQEAALTGESLPIKKEITVYDEELPVGDRKNMVFSGTVITSGKGKAVVVSTGMKTEIGKIATMLQDTKKELTPLQKRLEQLGKFLTILILAICAVVFGAGVFRGMAIVDIFIFAVGLAVAAIPEGLPAVVTISLSLGVKRMVKRNALIRKLPSVETLGCTTVICSDKTGTLTHNEMTVKKIYADDEIIEVKGSGYEPKGSFSKSTKSLELLLKIGVLNNDARIDKEGKEYKIIGDPTEGALIVSAEKAGINKEILENKYPRKKEIPFDSSRKMMTTIHHIDEKKYAYVKGAPDILLDRCNRVIEHGKIKKLTKNQKKIIMDANQNFANDALRVLGFAYKEIKTDKKKEWEKNLIFVGLQGMIDPPRKEVKDSIAKCKTAGIKVIMITGDFKGTAVAIGRDLNIEGKAITGTDLENIDLSKEVGNIGIYARVNPEDKMKIVAALKEKGHVVAMTGDGVNDAPALKRSDLGISMGITGTDVAKEASDMILTDDNFTSIVNAVEEGRTIYDNIRKFVVYLLSSNIGEVFVAFFSLIFLKTLPVGVKQLLWINLVTDGAPATALSVEPGEKGLMNHGPRKKDENIINKNIGVSMFIIGFIMMIATLGMFIYSLKLTGWNFGMPFDEKSHDFIYASTVAFTTLMMLQMFNVLNAKSQRESVLNKEMFSNKYLWFAIMTSIILQLVVIYTPLNAIFGTVPLGLKDWILITIVSSSVLFVGELLKLIGIKHKE
ncbi:calcium-translocating P-type ATPase, SERCA-type [Candidatus Woesearchaeota archaeon]|nr:calcium-translocating P-type ATPase, SERCA-type [Candidatus Woesearchaeota archaeon]